MPVHTGSDRQLVMKIRWLYWGYMQSYRIVAEACEPQLPIDIQKEGVDSYLVSSR